MKRTDESIFTEDLLRAFVKLTPQKTDIEALAPFKDLSPAEKAELGDADQFFLEIMYAFLLLNFLPCSLMILYFIFTDFFIFLGISPVLRAVSLPFCSKRLSKFCMRS